MGTETLLKQVKRALEEHGISMTVEKAITTTSIYAKLDNGALKSLRIGDHAGKRKYQYGYEIGTHIRNYQEFFGTFDGKTFIRLKFPADQVAALVEAVRLERTNKILKYGQFAYDKMKDSKK